MQRDRSAQPLRPRRLPAVLLVLACLAGAVLAQTFQYSRGWTNGRKRGGPAVPSVSADEPSPCQLQRLRLLLEGRGTSQLYLPCEMWRAGGEPSMSDDVSEHFRRRSPLRVLAPGLKNADSDVEEI